jgi:gamma-polyglutamate synthase
MGWLDRLLESIHLWKDLWFSPAGNTLGELGAVAFILLALMIWRTVTRQRRVTRLRGRIPLIIGGWGTRGKSGSERKKAALLTALGARYISKTTGCEAMFVLGPDGEEAIEYYLFRPHDKATIVEQTDVLTVAEAMECDAMLWECMALQYDYVRVLEQAWMRDDLSTLTNAYPDHEDIQGPAGRDVAYSIANFMKPGGNIFASEETMVPIFREIARKRKANLDVLDPELGDLICPDVLERYPYSAHPKNLSLTIRMGEALGCSRDFTLKQVAEHVVPDLGVMKTYPEVEVKGRWLKFSNGMSANERAGTIHNWIRLKLDNPETNRRDHVVLVINNRADRVPRSKVFASILADDLAHHQIVAIGSNLGGLRGYLQDALRVRVERLAVPPDNPDAYLKQIMDRDAGYLRFQLRTPEELGQRLADISGKDDREFVEAMKAAADAPADRLLGEFKRLAPEAVEEESTFAAREVERYVALRTQRQQLMAAIAGGRSAMEAWLAQYKEWYFNTALSAFFVMEDFYSKGPDTIRTVASRIPPRARAHVIGIQNIKGTGLDFAERWVRVGGLHRSTVRLTSPDPLLREMGAKAILSTPMLVDFEAGMIRRQIAEATSSGRGLDPEAGKFVAQIEVKIKQDAEEAAKKAAAAAGAKPSRVRDTLKVVIQKLELLFDSVDAVYRRRMARRVMLDLSKGRIASVQAIDLLKAYVARQKGGWLERLVKERLKIKL